MESRMNTGTLSNKWTMNDTNHSKAVYEDENANVDETNEVGDIDSTAAIIVTSKDKQQLQQPKLLYNDNNNFHDDTSTIATESSSVIVARAKKVAASSSIPPTSNGSNSTATTTTIKLPPLRPMTYGLLSLLTRRDDDHDDVHADEKKQDDDSNNVATNSVGAALQTVDDRIDRMTERTPGNVVVSMDTTKTEETLVTTSKIATNDDAVVAATNETNDFDNTIEMESIINPDQVEEPSSTDKKQQHRRDLFMIIHKEVQSSHLQPRPPAQTKTARMPQALLVVDKEKDFNATDLDGPSSVLDDLGDDEPQTNPSKRRGRPKGQKNKLKSFADEHDNDVVTKRAKPEMKKTCPKDDIDAISKPKAPLYAYELFSRDYLRAYNAMNPEAAGMDQDTLNSITLQEWKTMSDTSKKPYIIRATQDQQMYHQQVQIWEKNNKNQIRNDTVAGTTNQSISNKGGYNNPNILKQSLANPTTSTNNQPNTNNDNFTSRGSRGRPRSAPDPTDRKIQDDVQLNGNSNNTKSLSPRPRGRPKLLTNVADGSMDQVNRNDPNNGSPKPRGRPKAGHVWDYQSGQWTKNSSNEATKNRNTSSGTNNLPINLPNDVKVVVSGPSNPKSEKERDRGVAMKDDNKQWYTKLQSTPASMNGSEDKNLPAADHDTKAINVAAPKARSQHILNPKRPPKINQDGSYRKPGGPQPVGYKWDAEYGYWESVIASDSNLQRILDFDNDDLEEEQMKAEPQGRRQSTGSTLTVAQRKRKYTDDGCIIPRQTLETLRDGTYARPMGRPIVGYDWDAVKGLWAPSSQVEQRHSLSTIEPKDHRRKTSVATAGNKNRLYTSDGCILPIKTPMKADDGTFIRPFGRSIVGYVWDYPRGVWAPTGAPIPAKNAMPRPPSHIISEPIRLADKLVIVNDSKYVACTRCDACTMTENCGSCLYCMILQGKRNHPNAPYLVCSYRICQEPVLKSKHTDHSSDKNAIREEATGHGYDDVGMDDDEDEDFDGAPNADEKVEDADERGDIDDDSILESLSDDIVAAADDDGDDNNMMTGLDIE